MSPANSSPQVAVLLPVHNGERYVESAVRSIMEQTLRDIEIVIVDDASTDTTPAILARLAAEDPRIRILRPESNLRLARALNYGLDRIDAPYVARMDADDIALPTRLEVQKAYLDAHPEVALVGAGVIHIDGEGRTIRRYPFAGDAAAVRWHLRFLQPFCHPTFMFRRSAMPLRYDPAATVSEDYDLLCRLAQQASIVCLPEILLQYRVHDVSISGENWVLQMQQAHDIGRRMQDADMAHDLVEGLDPFRRAFYFRQSLDSAAQAAMFEGMRKMLSADTRHMPHNSRWMRRKSAGFLWTALWRAGLNKRKAIRSLIRNGPDFLVALALNKLDMSGKLPAVLQAGPDVRST